MLVVYGVIPFMKIDGITLYPFIFVRKKSLLQNKRLINHEKIHVKQELELLIVPFYLLYLTHYLYNLLKFKNHRKAYLNIFFEKEAYQNDYDLKYLKNRKVFESFKYLLSKQIN